MSRGLKFQREEGEEQEELFCLCSENKDVEKLRGDHGANMRLCSRICKNRFSQAAQLSISLLHFYSLNAQE